MQSKGCLQKCRQVPRKQQKMVKLPTAGIYYAFQRKKGKGTWCDLTQRKPKLWSYLLERSHWQLAQEFGRGAGVGLGGRTGVGGGRALTKLFPSLWPPSAWAQPGERGQETSEVAHKVSFTGTEHVVIRGTPTWGSVVTLTTGFPDPAHNCPPTSRHPCCRLPTHSGQEIPLQCSADHSTPLSKTLRALYPANPDCTVKPQDPLINWLCAPPRSLYLHECKGLVQHKPLIEHPQPLPSLGCCYREGLAASEPEIRPCGPPKTPSGLPGTLAELVSELCLLWPAEGAMTPNNVESTFGGHPGRGVARALSSAWCLQAGQLSNPRNALVKLFFFFNANHGLKYILPCNLVHTYAYIYYRVLILICPNLIADISQW